ncbi:hypothetical protein NA57DRAFT_55447 [Rhizodiscina lignyota]|uniref:DUF1989 domain-containing protein n=1 Tax=Rhizodiscina lignyota TaxID=1504668 RepID=A0A9P4IJ77_9PEZI|nr:hypothetical protein NA57DRAFT_55447 [Rhizodiscina lignyota]
MSSSLPEIQQIPARHGTATFVPKGHIIKIINTYGRQVVDTWAFALPNPPTQEEMDEDDEREEEARRVQEEVENMQGEEEGGDNDEAAGQEEEALQEGEASAGAEQQEKGPGEEQTGKGNEEEVSGEISPEKHEADEGAQKVPGSETETDGEKAKDAAAQAEKATPSKAAGWGAYIPSISRSRGSTAGAEAKTAQKSEQENKTPTKTGEKKTWASYITRQGGPSKAEEKSKAKAKEGEQRTWGSYIPSGQGFSNYVPSSRSVSAFTRSHYRDPTKSIAEQMYDFSKTPVGAGAISAKLTRSLNTAASGSGYAGSAYAAYQAWSSKQAALQTGPPMEYLSMPHTHTATFHLIPKLNDTLVSNLRKPMLTVIEDTSAVHDTLIAACDPQRYRELGVQNWEEHGSCAENLVLALKELNQKAGLKGSKAVGTDVTVNTVPAPLNLFMNIPWKDDGVVTFEPPRGKKGEFIRLKAERDVVVVMSACPMDVTPVNGGKCMAAHFIVQEPEKKTPLKKPVKKAASAAKKAPAPQTATPQKPAIATPTKKTGGPVKRPSQTNTTNSQAAAARKPSQPRRAPATNGATTGAAERRESSPQVNQPKPGRPKPKKLEKRTPSHTSAAQ